MKKKYKKNIDLINQITGKLNEKKLFQTNEKILISISSGQDSSCLMIIFLQMKKQWNFHIGLLWCNHLWQMDAFFIAKHLFNISFFFKTPIYFNITIEKNFTEQKARNWRYEKFHRHSKFYSYDVLLTGHTASDQIETLLFHLLRGSSPKGLCALNWIKYKLINQKYFFSKLINFKSQIKIFQLKKTNFLPTQTIFNLPLTKRNAQTIKKFILITSIQHIYMLSCIMFLFIHYSELEKKDYKQKYKNNYLNKKLHKDLAYGFIFSYKTNFLKIKFTFVKILHIRLYFWKPCKLKLKTAIFSKLKNSFFISLYLPFNVELVTPRQAVIRQQLMTIAKNRQKIYLYQVQKNVKFNFGLDISNISNSIIEINLRKLSTSRLQYNHLKKILNKNEKLAQIFPYHINLVLHSYPKSVNYKTKVTNYREKLFPTEINELNEITIKKKYILSDYFWYINSKYEKTVFNFKSFKLKTNLCQQPETSVEAREKKIILKNSELRKKNQIKKMEFKYNIHFVRANAYNAVKKNLYCYKNSQNQIKNQKKIAFLLNKKTPTLFFSKKTSRKIIKKFLWASFNSNKYLGDCLNFLKNQENKNKILFYDSKLTKFENNFLTNRFLNFDQHKNLKTIFDLKQNSHHLNIFVILPHHPTKHIFSQKLVFYSTPISISDPQITNPLISSYYKNQGTLNLIRSGNRNFKNFYKNKNEIPYQVSFQKKKFNFKTLLKKSLNRKSILFYSIIQVSSGIPVNSKISNFKRLRHYIDFYLFELSQSFFKKNNLVGWLVSAPTPEIFQLKYKLKVIRPLLIFNRFDLKKLCQFWDLPIYPDKTNEKLKYSRNQIRKQLLPALRFFFNPRVDYLLNQFIEILNEEQNYFEFLTIRLKNQLQKKENNKLKVNLLILRKLPLSIQRKILEKILKLNFNKNITFFHIETLLSCLETNREKEISSVPLKSYFFLPPHKKQQLNNFSSNKIKFNKNSHSLSNLGFITPLKEKISTKQTNKCIPTPLASNKVKFEPPITFFITGIGTILIYSEKIVLFY
jgi:tRNA(Ile)-lysidine synthetase-like protein